MTIDYLLLLGVRDYLGSGGSVLNCTFDGNRYGVTVLSSGELTVVNCLFAGSVKDGGVGHGISYRSSEAGLLSESYNAFWGNDFDIYDYYAPEEIDINTDEGDIALSADPYDSGWDDFGDRFCLDQGGDCVVEGGYGSADGWEFYRTAYSGVRDVGDIDVGYHYPGRIRYVDASKTDGDQSGLSWGSAYQYLQDALDVVVSDGLTAVIVAGGTYYPDIDRNDDDPVYDPDHDPEERYETFALQNGLGLYGGFAGDENPFDFDMSSRNFVTNKTILSGEIKDAGIADNSYHVVLVIGDALIDGVTIKNGNADYMGPDPNYDLTGNSYGGGIYHYDGDLEVLRCEFIDNDAIRGGAVGNLAISEASILYESCTFESNKSQNTYWYALGGAVYYSVYTPTFKDCLFDENEADMGGAIYGYSTLSENGSIEGCTFSNNIGNYDGGAIYCDSTMPDIFNGLFYGNEGGDGGAIYAYYVPGTSVITNCTFSDNTAQSYAGAIYSKYSNKLEVSNTILWGNFDSTADNWDLLVDGGQVDITYCDLWAANYFTGTGAVLNVSDYISADPLFADAANGDFHLKSLVGRWVGGTSPWTTDTVHSPCIDAGDGSSYSNEPEDNGNNRINMGAYGNTSEASKTVVYRLTVNLVSNDAQALPADCKWYLASDTGTKYSSGTTLIVESGSDTVMFECNSGTPYIAPSNQGITINSATKTVTGTYKACGWISAVGYYYNDNGIVSTAGWKTQIDSYHLGERKYVPGTYTVTFQSVSEHAPPPATIVVLPKNGSYSPTDQWHRRTTIYVDENNGSDSNHGGSGNPYEHINQALGMMPTDTFTSMTKYIYLKRYDGTQYEDVSFPTNKTVHFYPWGTGLSIFVYGDHSPSPKPNNIIEHGVYFRW